MVIVLGKVETSEASVRFNQTSSPGTDVKRVGVLLSYKCQGEEGAVSETSEASVLATVSKRCVER